jgi:hypothetical protein
MTAGRSVIWWAAKTRAVGAFCLAGALIGAGLYFGNLSYVTAGDDAAARAAAAADQARIKAEAAQRAGIVTLSPAAVGSPKALQVLDVLRMYFNAINTRNYAEYSSAFDQAMRAGQSQSEFEAGYATVTESNEVIKTITINSDGTVTASVSFISHQSADASVDASPCTHWMINYYLVAQGKGYVIGPSPSGYQPTYSDCELSTCGLPTIVSPNESRFRTTPPAEGRGWRRPRRGPGRETPTARCLEYCDAGFWVRYYQAEVWLYLLAQQARAMADAPMAPFRRDLEAGETPTAERPSFQEVTLLSVDRVPAPVKRMTA